MYHILVVVTRVERPLAAVGDIYSHKLSLKHVHGPVRKKVLILTNCEVSGSQTLEIIDPLTIQQGLLLFFLTISPCFGIFCVFGVCSAHWEFNLFRGAMTFFPA